MDIKRIDHIVLTVKDIDVTLDFYTGVLGMEAATITRKNSVRDMQVLKFGNQRMNLHEYGNERQPNAAQALPGSQDLCFVVDVSIDNVIARLEKLNIKIEFGPVIIPGAVGQMESVFIRDPDQNLIELAYYL
ncbi:VOC family protein [Piscirickettsia salmonis]|uniref:VOC family protein n=1 Tax=Piscirickettsia salmonis TaxID=1238 RepID=UPI00030D9332|nr:VOC family protein [Piscirickettsia salmonis]RNC78935.1 VOC family protein [Piscirickettsiaceae bacterium NZ-RLO2]APS57756.1 glyoxalase [Piscirickettsia salmonis]ERL62988.1 glyoxalase/Bleomycin resistance /Dioxygenase superfamily protein [Piscirickettsia salmonis LF-89 = ATCC VR-1361]PEQ15988.1 VOC family virulence protein [Piscirickettsia salmonis]QGN76049.1 Virulence protein [Piscirickettsia salmonis]